VEALLRHSYSHNVRELGILLWKAVAGSHRDYVALTPEVRAELASVAPRPELEPHEPGAGELLPEDIVDCLNRSGHNIAVASRDLGLRSRYALYRLMRKHGIVVERAVK